MGTATGSDNDKQAFETRLQAAQAENVLSNMGLTLGANIFISSSTVGIVWYEGQGHGMAYWLASVTLLAIARYFFCREVVKRGAHLKHPETVLRLLTLAAFVSGLCWIPVPVSYVDPGNRIAVGYLIFVMAGMATGAIIQSLVYWPTAIAFGVPLMGSTLLMLLARGDTVDYVIATNVLLLAVMLFRSSILGQRGFRHSRGTAMRAVTLAESLTQANREINRSHMALEVIANRDTLTGLSNRSVFNARIAAACLAARRGEEEAALLLFDIDKFKLINDTRGHHAGDQVLKAVAVKLQGLCKGDDLAVRLGGDEFAVLVVGDEAGNRARALAERWLDTLAAPLQLGAYTTEISASIGIARCPDHALGEDDLYACADLALYHAKEAGRRCLREFDHVLKARLDFQRCLDRDLEDAFDRGEIEVHFQPQVSLDGSSVSGFEALIRWTHREIGPINPEEIVAAAAHLQLTRRLTAYVAEAAFVFLCRLAAHGRADIIVSINMSPTEFSLYSPAHMLLALAGRYGVAPNRLEVEITEEAILDPQKVEPELALLQDAGFHIAVDDFGMGHSSLSHLVSLKIDRLKVDRSFVQGIHQSCHNQALVSALVSVGHALNLELVMEGVENQAEAEALRLLGCRIGQGWLYGKAMREDDAIRWLEARGAADRQAAGSVLRLRKTANGQRGQRKSR